MATMKTIDVGAVFPEGLSVGAYKRSNWTVAQPFAGAPQGSADATVAVSGGVLAFTGLTSGIEYVAVADIGGGVYRYVGFSTKDPPASVSSEAAARSAADSAETAARIAADLLEQDAATAATDAELATEAAARVAGDAAEATARDAAIEVHRADTTDVHGIADTSLLDTAAARATAVAGEATARDAAIEVHRVDTTDVHGITDTSALDTVSARAAAIAALSSVYQPLDSDLTAIAALTTTSYGRSLLEAANAAALRALAGLVIGTDVQAYDVELGAIAGLTSAADKVPYFTGSGVAALADFSSFGRSLVDDANAAAALATLGAAANTVDAAAGTGSLRTLGTTSTSAGRGDQLNDLLNAYKHLHARGGLYTTTAVTGSVYLLLPNLTGSPSQVSGISVAAVPGFRFNPADYAVAGRTTKLNIEVECDVNATGPGVTFTVGMYPYTVAGANAGQLNYTVGTVVTGSTVAMASPGAGSNPYSSGDFDAPTAGPYLLGVTTSGTPAVNSGTGIDAVLQVRQV